MRRLSSMTMTISSLIYFPHLASETALLVFLHLNCGSSSESYACPFSFPLPLNYRLVGGSEFVMEDRLVCTLWCFHSVVSYFSSPSILMSEEIRVKEEIISNVTYKVPTLFFLSPSSLCLAKPCYFLCFPYLLFFLAGFSHSVSTQKTPHHRGTLQPLT